MVGGREVDLLRRECIVGPQCGEESCEEAVGGHRMAFHGISKYIIEMGEADGWVHFGSNYTTVELAASRADFSCNEPFPSTWQLHPSISIEL